MQYCSLQHWALVSPPGKSTAKHHFCLEQTASFFLVLLVIAFHSSLVAYWTPSHLGCSSFSVISFCLFILFKGFSQQEYWSGLPFPLSVDHILSELFTVILHGSKSCHGEGACVTQWSYEPCCAGPSKTDRWQGRALTKHGPLEEEMANYFRILAARTSWTV